MKLKAFFAGIAIPIFAALPSVMTVSAATGNEPLQTCFSEDGAYMTIFTSTPLQEDASLLIGNTALTAEVKGSGVQVNTLFLIDNSSSMPVKLRDELKSAVTDYVSAMPETERVKIAAFDTKTTVHAAEYSADPEFISYELSKVDFKGKGSLVYDAVMNVIEQEKPDEDAYFRTVLITDGIDSVEGTSFDLLRTAISGSSRNHVDVVQVSSGGKQDVNLAAIGSLGSNTYMMFESGSDFSPLAAGEISMLKAKLTNALTTGELKGVTIKNGAENISLGSVLIPQAELPPDETEPPETTTAAPETTSAETEAETTASTESAEAEKSEGRGTLWLIIGAAAAALLLAAGGILLFLRRRPKKKLVCRIAVQITKDVPSDQKGVGPDVWEFDEDGEFRVGRIPEPRAEDGSALPKNHRAICEDASNDDIGSIGRNAFVLRYDRKTETVTVRNAAQGAVFAVDSENGHTELRSGQSTALTKGCRILLGNYTTVTVSQITVS